MIIKLLNMKVMVLVSILTFVAGISAVAADEGGVSERVIITGEKIHIEADQLTFDTETGVVEATGSVKVTIDDMVYYTESITYDMQKASGVMTSFNGTVYSERNVKLSGASVALSEDTTTISEVNLTRCELDNPHYQFSAKEVTIAGKKIRLERVVLRIKGVPVFYLPRLIMDLERKMPDVRIGYSNDDGLKYAFDYFAELTAHSNFLFSGDLSVNGESVLGFGLESTYQGLQNRLEFQYSSDTEWAFKDEFAFEDSHWLIAADVFHDFSSGGETQYGAKATRKYWETSWGSWQISVLAREATETEGSQKYGGFYTGWQVDYKPHPNVVLSYLRIDSHSSRDYGDLLEDYDLGDNWLYNLDVPVGDGYVIGVSGVYNSDDAGWIHQIFSVSKESCCFKTEISYDHAEDSLELSFRVKF